MPDLRQRNRNALRLILAMSCLSGIRHFTSSCLPMDDQLNLHLNAKDFSPCPGITMEQFLPNYGSAAPAAMRNNPLYCTSTCRGKRSAFLVIFGEGLTPSVL